MLNISSAATSVLMPNSAIYTGAKGAVDAITGVLANELGPRRIRVDAINPGVVETEGSHAAGVIGPEFASGAALASPPPRPRDGPVKLILHPASPRGAVESVEAIADIRRGASLLAWRVAGPVRVPPPAAAIRTDELWRTTCFELFVKPIGGEGYFEFNFSPSTAWAAYRFDGYRKGMADLPLAPPRIERLADGVRVAIDLRGLPEGGWRVGITAVIEEEDGTRTFWALAHPPGKPDFHHPDCFALELPAPSGT